MNAYTEIKTALVKWRIWYTLAIKDIQIRYKRSSLGPLWITLSMAVTICSMGFLYSYLFRVDMDEYFPYLASGIICWGLISSILNESPNCFIDSEMYIRNIHLPFTVFTFQLIVRNTIIFFHNILVFIPIIFLFHVHLGLSTLFIIPGLMMLVINGILYGTIISVLGVRYRDFSPIIMSITQVGFFLTPIIWTPSLLPNKLLLALEFNPFYQVLNLIRKPLLGQYLTHQNIIAIMVITLVGLLTFSWVINKYKNRVVFWW